MIDEKVKQRIDNMNYIEMLSRWRFAPVGDPMFQGGVGDYYSKVMKEKRGKISDEEHVRASKTIGWGGDEKHTNILTYNREQ